MRIMTLNIAMTLATLAAPALAEQGPTSTPPAPSFLDRMLAMAQPPKSAWAPNQLAQMERIRDAALKDAYAFDQLAYLTDVIGPRPNGSPQAGVAIERVAAQMRALGAKVRLEPTAVSHWVRGGEAAVLTRWSGMTEGFVQKVVVTALGNSIATPPEGLSARIVVVNSFAELRAQPAGSLIGKIVLFNYAFDPNLVANGQAVNAYAKSATYRAVGPAVASKMGAAAVLVRSVSGADYRLPHTGAAIFPDGVRALPVAAVTVEDAELIARLSRRGPVSMKLILTPQSLPQATSYNVIADWPGSAHPEQVVLVSGHVDSWDLGTGALDDGAGLVIAMETIRLLSTLDIHPKRTIRFVAWMDEEMGQRGARAYLEDPANAAVDHVAVLETDRGAGRSFGISFSGSPTLHAYLAPVADVLEPIGAGLVVTDEEIGEDVAGLMARGVPGFTPAQDLRTYFQYHHSAADTLDKVDPVQLAQTAAVNAVTAYALADAVERPPR